MSVNKASGWTTDDGSMFVHEQDAIDYERTADLYEFMIDAAIKKGELPLEDEAKEGAKALADAILENFDVIRKGG